MPRSARPAILPMAESPPLIHNIKQLNILAGSYADETAHHIKMLTQAVQSIVPGDEYDRLTIEGAHASHSSSLNTEDRIILELENQRVSLIQEIQDQNATSSRLLEMIGEYEELIKALTTYPAEFVNKTSQDATSESEKSQSLRFTKLYVVERALDANLPRVRECLEELKVTYETEIKLSQQKFENCCTPESHKHLSDLISKLNSVDYLSGRY